MKMSRTMALSRVGFFILFVLILVSVETPCWAQAADENEQAVDPRDRMDLALGLGAGLLEFFHTEGGLIINRKWTIGLMLGTFPVDAVLANVMGVDDLHGATTVEGFVIEGDVETSLGSGAIFARFFPWGRFLYLDVELALWNLSATAGGRITLEDDELLDVSATATVWVPMLGLHGGWRFLFRKGFYLDLGVGLNLLLSPGADVDFGGATIVQLYQYPEAAAVLNDAQDYLSVALEDGANRIAKGKLFPTVWLRLGWAFDAWGRRAEAN